jgi:hypothetical protein
VGFFAFGCFAARPSSPLPSGGGGEGLFCVLSSPIRKPTAVGEGPSRSREPLYWCRVAPPPTAVGFRGGDDRTQKSPSPPPPEGGGEEGRAAKHPNAKKPTHRSSGGVQGSGYSFEARGHTKHHTGSMPVICTLKCSTQRAAFNPPVGFYVVIVECMEVRVEMEESGTWWRSYVVHG